MEPNLHQKNASKVLEKEHKSQKFTSKKYKNGFLVYNSPINFLANRRVNLNFWQKLTNINSPAAIILLRIIKIIVEFFIIFMIILSLTFFMINSIPGSSSITSGLNEAQKTAIETKYGLNLPLWTRFGNYLANFFKGEFGISLSLFPSVPINDFIWERFLKSFLVGIFSILLTIVIGIPLGIYVGKRPGSLVDTISTFFISLFSAFPALIMALLLVIIGRAAGAKYVFDYKDFWTYILPGLALSLGSIVGYVKWIRTGLNDELNSMHAKFAYLKGATKNRFVWLHALKSSLFPIAVFFPAVVLSSFIGSLFIERIFAITGSGGLLISGIQSKDYNVVLFLLSISVLTSILGYMIRDITLELLDPRIRLKKG